VNGPGTDRDFGAEVAREDRPLTGHEIGQWTFYPNLEEAAKYSGVLAARNFDLVRADLAAKHLLDLAPRIAQATGRHAALLYKEEIEVLLRTPNHAGFSLLDLHDYPGQGTALVGLLDPFWDSKGFVTPAEHRRYCGPTVLLLRLPKRIYTSGEALVAEAELAHFGRAPLADVVPIWTLRDDRGGEVESGELPSRTVATGKLERLGSIRSGLSSAAAPCRLTATLALRGTEFANSWEIWVYPQGPVEPPAGLVVSRDWDEATKKALANGQPVLLFPRFLSRSNALPGRFLPVFWSPVWFPQQRPNTMGILCDPQHPALAQFPTDFHSNWQWYELLDHSRSIILDETPATFRPIVQVIDNFARNHKLGHLFETKVGAGRLLVCTIDLPGLVPANPAARQLLASLQSYAASSAFRPDAELPGAWLDQIFHAGQADVMQRLGGRVVSTDSQQPGFEADNILDGEESTIWHTTFGGKAAPFPHEVIIEFKRPVRLAGVRLQPRMDQANGWIKECRVDVGLDGKTWTQSARATLDRSDGEKRVHFPAPVTARFLRLVAEAPFDSQSFASLAELSVIEPKE
jgi:hypothetical protein